MQANASSLENDVPSEDRLLYEKLGYNKDLLPVPLKERNWNTFNYFTLWMGSVYNVPSYMGVGVFLFLGLSPINVMLSLIISSIFVALIMVLNGAAGSKYGIPFSIALKASFGERGAKLPGFLRGCVAAIMWYGIQNFAGSTALYILITKLFPGFQNMASGVSILGLSLPQMICFLVFWAVNLAIGLGGGAILRKFTAILNPFIYIVFGGMTIWAIKMAGGIGAIMSFESASTSNYNPIFVYLMIISSILSVWGAPAVSASDFTKSAKSYKAQFKGQSLGLLVAYLIFAFSSVCILIGASIKFDTNMWSILDIINKWDSLFAISLATLVLLMTTISTNATGNIIPAGYQLVALFPKKINYKKGVILASVISALIQPWKLMENEAGIYAFLDIIGAVVGPVAGVMICHYFFIAKQDLDLDKLYGASGTTSLYKHGVSYVAYAATLVGVALPFIFKLFASLKFLSSLSWIIGFTASFVIYFAFSYGKITNITTTLNEK